MDFITELKRRNVFRVGAAYAVVAWLLIQVAETVFPLFGFDDAPAKIVVIILALGFVPVLLFAWAFELTPEGVKKESEIDRSQSITGQTGRKLDRVIIAVLVIAVAYFAWDKFGGGPGAVETASEPELEQAAVESEPEVPSVAVLPFVNMSSNEENEYFSDGLTETLLHILAQLPDLKVAARTSAFSFKGKNIDVREIGQTLGVEHILEGSVQRAGEQIRVTAQLVRASDGFHVWSENFDRRLVDIFSIQDEIATHVADALQASLGGAQSEVHSLSTHDVDAYDLFLKALSTQAVFSYGSLGEAESLFKQALAIDPDFVEAKLALAWNYYRQAWTGLISEADSVEQATPLVEQALQAEPDLPMTRALNDITIMQTSKLTLDVSTSMEALERLLVLLEEYPNQTFAVLTASSFMRFFDREQEAETVIRRSLNSDPLAAELHRELAHLLLDQDRLDEARAAIDTALELAPERPNNFGVLVRYHTKNNDLAEAIRARLKAIELDPEDPELTSGLAYWLQNLDLPESAEPWVNRTLAIAPQSAAARQTLLAQAVRRGDEAAVERMARKIVTDDIENRRGVVFDAMLQLQILYFKQGRPQEHEAFLLSTHPEAADFTALPENQNSSIAQGYLLEYHVLTDPGFDRKAASDRFRSLIEQKGVPITEGDWNDTWLMLIAGDYDAAAEAFLANRLSENWIQDVSIFEVFEEPLWQPLKEHPGISARLAELEREKLEQREQVLAMLESEGL